MLLPIVLEEVRCIPKTEFCELYMVEFWEGTVLNSFSCRTIPRAWHTPWFLCSFSCYTVDSILYT